MEAGPGWEQAWGGAWLEGAFWAELREARLPTCPRVLPPLRSLFLVRLASLLSLQTALSLDAPGMRHGDFSPWTPGACHTDTLILSPLPTSPYVWAWIPGPHGVCSQCLSSGQGVPWCRVKDSDGVEVGACLVSSYTFVLAVPSYPTPSVDTWVLSTQLLCSGSSGWLWW